MFGFAEWTPAASPGSQKTYLGAEAGTVTKVGSGSITVKIPRSVQSGTTRKRIGNRTVNVPKYTTKQVGTTFDLSNNVVVKTISGKSASLGDIKPGMTVRVHGYRVTEQSSGMQPTSHVEVERIEFDPSSGK